eukprot:SAG31_NODE_1249_length_9118_cov_23.165318_9_plen_98_part_00
MKARALESKVRAPRRLPLAKFFAQPPCAARVLQNRDARELSEIVGGVGLPVLSSRNRNITLRLDLLLEIAPYFAALVAGRRQAAGGAKPCAAPSARS